tara:strand:+ start:2003 stop:2497 length:495 start_codon:yes stop_codon:yes gene_type:complete
VGVRFLEEISMRKIVWLCMVLVFSPTSGLADQGYPYPQMQVIPSSQSFDKLVESLKTAIASHKMGLVTQACGSCGAKAQGYDIPGNFVAGVFRNDFARRLFAIHVPAGIEAPIRFYVTENADGTATLTYRLPSAIFAAYEVPALAPLGTELDEIFTAITKDAVK